MTTRICVYGAGAVGGHLAVRLAQLPDVELAIVARGEHLQAIQARGLALQTDAGTLHAPIRHAVADPALLPTQNLVLVTLKATALSEQASAIARLLGDDGAAVFLNNGIPWWWNHGLPSAPAETLELLDPHGLLWRVLGPQRAIAGVVYSPNEVVAPGVVSHRGHNLFLLGEPDGSPSERLLRIGALFEAAGLPHQHPGDIRAAIWQKLLLNISGNPIAALTRLDTVARARQADLMALSNQLQQEIRAIAAALGWPSLPQAPAAQSPAQVLNSHPSMLQDVLRNRPLEVEALLGQPVRFARQHGVPTPGLDVVLALLRGLNLALTHPVSTSSAA